jgi:hypothetical protein
VGGLDRDDPEALVPAGLAPGRLAVGACEEAGHGLGEVAQGLLLHHLAAIAQPPGRGPGLGQLRRLRHVARRAPAPGTPPRLLLDGKVPDVPGVRTMRPHNPFLIRGNDQAVTAHANTISSNADNPEEVKRRPPTRAKAGISTPRHR